jgi:hypothetical protein
MSNPSPVEMVDTPKVIDSDPQVAEPTSGQWINRGVRTAIQLGFVTAVIQLWNAFAATPLTATQVEAVYGFGTIVLAIFQVIAEDKLGVAILRTPATK